MPTPAKAKQQIADQLADQLASQAAKVIPAVGTAMIAAVVKIDWSRANVLTPTERLRRKIDITAQVADRMRREALADADSQAATRAAGWGKRARQLRNGLDLPVTTSKAAHRRQIKAALATLHQQMGPTATAAVAALTADVSGDTDETDGGQQ